MLRILPVAVLALTLVFSAVAMSGNTPAASTGSLGQAVSLTQAECFRLIGAPQVTPIATLPDSVQVSLELAGSASYGTVGSGVAVAATVLGDIPYVAGVPLAAGDRKKLSDRCEAVYGS
ncbi:MAG: hypothetical protein ACPGO3_03300 [Magnetospiraceae bacterium]